MFEINIAVTRSFLDSLESVDKKARKKASELLEKFRENPTAASINYERIHDMKDDKVRTVRVDQKYRAIVLHPETGNTYLFVYIDNHDEAMDWAKKRIFDFNKHTSAFQVIDMDIVDKVNDIEKENNFEINFSLMNMYSEEELMSVGIPKQIIPVLKFVKNNKDLIDNVKDYVSEDIFEILEYCIDGIPIDEIREAFDIAPAIENESFEQMIQKPVNQSYIKVVSNDESINDILDNPIDYWRIFLHPVQKKYVEGSDGNYKGSFQLKGAAGTGKTVVAMHRAKYLAEHIYTDDGDMILYTTFSKKLTKSVEYNLKNMCGLETLKRIEVVNLHSLIKKYLDKYSYPFKILYDKKLRVDFVEEAIERAGKAELFNVKDIIQEIDIVLSYYGISTLEDYLKVSRNGTYKKLGKNQRIELWDIIREYNEILYYQNYKEWWSVVGDAINYLKRSELASYKAIIVDEAQDFGMAEYRFLRNLVPEKENDLFIVGDIRQKIYPVNVNFSKCNINILGNRTNQLTLNYRNTHQINIFANKIIDNIKFIDMDASVTEYNKSNAIINGDEPIIKTLRDYEDECDFVFDEINKITESGIMHNEIAIISRTNGFINKVVNNLTERGLNLMPLEDVDSINNKNVYFGTMHSVKGFEFKVVFIVGANTQSIPLQSHVNRLEHEREKNDFIRMEKSLLYVAATRARDRLYILGSPKISEWMIDTPKLV